mgnify:CR=1 FL=1
MNQVILKGVGTYLNTLSYISPQKAAEKSFDIFCTPHAKPIQPHQQEFLDTAEQFTLSFEEKQIQCYRWGNGPISVLFLHGWQSHTFRWKKYIEALPKDEFTVYSLDGPAHGNSEGKIFNIPMYKRLVDKFLLDVIQPDVVVGHSMGGFSALYAFHDSPEKSPEKLVVMGSPGMASDFITIFEDMLGLSTRARTGMVNYFKNTLGKDPEFYDAAAFAKQQRATGLVIHDVGDEDVPVKYGREIHNNWPDSEYWETKGFGHKLRDEQVVTRVVDFIRP